MRSLGVSKSTNYNLLVDLLEDGDLLGGGLGPGVLPRLAAASRRLLTSRIAATAATWRPGLALRRLLEGVIIVLVTRGGKMKI